MNLKQVFFLYNSIEKYLMRVSAWLPYQVEVEWMLFELVFNEVFPLGAVRKLSRLKFFF